MYNKNLLLCSIQVIKVLRQGCGLSPTLFKISLHNNLKSLQQQSRNMGMTVEDEILYTIYYADDQIVATEDAYDLSYMIRKL